MIWLKQKGWNILTSGFSLSSTVQPVTVLEALYVLSYPGCQRLFFSRGWERDTLQAEALRSSYLGRSKGLCSQGKREIPRLAEAAPPRISLSISRKKLPLAPRVVLSGKRTKLSDKHFVYWFILYHISSSQAFCLRGVQFRSLIKWSFIYSLVCSPSTGILWTHNVTSSHAVGFIA